jgi:transglutaminase superfamily protein
MNNLAAKAFFGLLTYDLLRLRPRSFARLHRRIHEWPRSQRQPEPDVEERVREAVNLACIWYPKPARCLPRSAVATCLLRDEGIAAQMVIGVQKLPFKAHAWVEVDGRVVNDRPEVQTGYMVMDRL